MRETLQWYDLHVYPSNASLLFQMSVCTILSKEQVNKRVLWNSKCMFCTGFISFQIMTVVTCFHSISLQNIHTEFYWVIIQKTWWMFLFLLMQLKLHSSSFERYCGSIPNKNVLKLLKSVHSLNMILCLHSVFFFSLVRV